MYNYCKKNNKTKKGLLFEFDLSKYSTLNSSNYINNEGALLIESKWFNNVSDDINLIDYGLTMYDNGRTSSMEECYTLYKNDNHIKLYPVGQNDYTGNTDYSQYETDLIQDPNIGAYMNFNGGYFQGFFKLEGYNYELLPPRYNNGFTIETLLEISDTSSGIFYYMGTRSEDKYNPHLSGETYINNEEYEGVITSEKNNLSSYIDESVLSDNFKNYEEDKFHIEKISSEQIDNLKNNVISFEITPNKTIKIKTININGDLMEYESDNILTNGWKLIDVVFKPYETFNNYDGNKFKCYPMRKGDLNVFINGLLFWSLKNIDEFYTKPIKNHKEKQIGVPYNISWGGGSFGLKHSFHYDKNIINVYNNNDITYINDNFDVDGNVNYLYLPSDESVGLEILNGEKIIIKYNKQIELLGGHIQYMSVYINANIYDKLMDMGSIYLDVDGNFDNLTILSEQKFSTKRINPEWFELKFEFRVDKTCENLYFYPLIVIESNIGFVENSIFKFKNFIVENTNILNKDISKNNLYIEKYFDSSFIGRMQNLSLYNRSLMNDEIKNNAKKIFNNSFYNVIINDGGRIIYND